MDVIDQIKRHTQHPLTHQLLMSFLGDYSQPNIKISALVKKGILMPVKKGLYLVGPMVSGQTPEPFLLANHILGPSYVSLESALSFHGLIPEQVFEVTSVTTKASRKFKTRLGIFSYTRLPLPYYSFGLQQIKLGEEQYALVASPEKAVCDKIVTTRGIVLRSKKDTFNFLIENMRMDEENLKKLNIQEISSWLPETPKYGSISMLIRTIQGL
ncbi:MAG TPA: hypothetical protein VIN08_19835 [Ohtaekwangia sp.]|uniref:type IV toxin-antitoxin system AbiEi family antitoxin domain-containing protein n=1 Tax=Ohtaekwangia sp. TaxID=2066019 RepID=UPI002F95B182